ncbi:MAG: hypothetical protein ACD_86C00003G0023 [uncultured bacterium]|nr:MAG: hypothetical protein ACD_86C00003G0023 [uncultured bacterium]
MATRLLVNYHNSEHNYLSVLTYYLKKLGYEAVATSSTLSIGELVSKAQAANCQGIFLVNKDTLINCVPGTKPSLDDWRGSYLAFTIPTIVGNSLAHTQTVPYGAWLIEKDLLKFKQLPLKNKIEFSFTVLDSTDKFFDAFNDLNKAECIAYDIETKTINKEEEKGKEGGVLEGGDTIITCCSWTAIYADRSLKTFVLPLVNFLETHWVTDLDYCRAIQFMQAVNKLEIPKVMHNGMYDCTHSIIYNAEPHNWTLDTMAMMHSEFSELPKTLDFVASIALPDYCQWKAEAAEASKNHDIHRYYAYNAKDTFITARILLHYLNNLPAYAVKNYQSQFKLVYPALYCNFEGIKIDQEKRIELRSKEEHRLEESLKTLRTCLADENFNPSSPKQVKQYIYEVLGAKDPQVGMKKDAEGKRVKIIQGTNEKNLKQVGMQHPILLMVTSSIIEYREARKAISTYMDFLQKNGRLLYSLNPFGTETGRMACQSSSLWCGTQVQNIPYYAKDMLVADEGFEMFEIDNSQSEARCTAYLAGETNLIKALEEEGRDFYTSLGYLFFKVPYEEVSEFLRNKIIKKIVHGTNYMMGVTTFIENAGEQNLIDAASFLGIRISMSPKLKEGEKSLKEFAADVLESYHAPFPKVRQWYGSIKQEIMATHMLRSPLGHTRYFFGNVEKNHQAFNSAVAHAPQNLSVSVLNIGLWKTWQLVKKHEGKLRLKAQVHDSILAQVDKNHSEIMNEVIEAMQNPVVIHGRTLRIPTDIKVGDSWGNMEKKKG